jgi:signal transduction histidine kinase
MPPHVPPPAREWLATLFVGLFAWGLGPRFLHADGSWSVALGLSLFIVGVFAASRPLIDLARLARPTSARAKEKRVEGTFQPSVLGLMAPLLDDAIQRRPGRPRVIVRVPARRLLEAALDRARAVQGLPKSRREELRVEVISGDGDVDIDGDAAELAEALCAVLDNALRLKAQNPEVRVQVHLRGGPGHVTFEVSDGLPDGAAPAHAPNPDTPFLGARVQDLERPGLGVGLARARILVERNGGKLLTRTTEDGSCVQLTIPRRMQKSMIGHA